MGSDSDPDTIAEQLDVAHDHMERAEDLRSDAEEQIIEKVADQFDRDVRVVVDDIAGQSATVRVYQNDLADELFEAFEDEELSVRESSVLKLRIGPEEALAKTDRDRIKNVKQLIASIEEEHEDGAPVDVVKGRVRRIGMDLDTAEREIEKLKQKGEVYEPNLDHLRTA